MKEFTEIAQRSYDNKSQSPYIATSSNDMAHRVGLWCRDYSIYPQEVRESRGYTWIVNRNIKLSFKKSNNPVLVVA